MQLKDFVSQSLAQIMDGILEARQTAKGGKISPKIQLSGKASRSADTEFSRGDVVEYVEFDVAVSGTEGEKDKQGVGVVMAIIGAGMTTQAETARSHVSRLKFRIPVVWPSDE